MRNYIQRGDALTFTAVEAVVSGQGVTMGDLFGIAYTDAAAGEDFEAALVGVYELPKAVVEIPAGAKVFWDATAGAVTTTASGNLAIGAATAAAADTAATVAVRLG